MQRVFNGLLDSKPSLVTQDDDSLKILKVELDLVYGGA